jgi:peptidoglycan/LPS O-acetylase OafA/YrhL
MNPHLSITTSRPNVRSHGLDILRGIAILLVLIHHLFLVGPSGRNTWFYWLADTIRCGGWVGVDLFFVLSGFLISGILFRQFLNHGRLKPVEFLIRRGFKIYPAFWILVATMIGYQQLIGNPVKTPQIAVELLFIQNYFPGLSEHTWSLAVEEHCYVGLCLMLTLLATTRRSGNPFRCLPWLIALAAAFVLYLRVSSNVPRLPQNWMLFVTPTHLRCDAFLFGVLVSYGYYFCQPKFSTLFARFKTVAIIAGIACLAPVFVLNVHTNRLVTTWLFSTNAIGSSLLLIGMLGFTNRSSVFARPIAKLGEYSYSIYLWHMLIGNKLLLALFRQFHWSSHVAFWLPAYLLTTILSGIVLSHLLELPFLRLRELWFAESRVARDLPPNHDLCIQG